MQAMFQFIKNMFARKSIDFKVLVATGAVIVDVRTPAEFANGNFKGSRNIPLSVLKNKVNELKKLNRPVITVCASGTRSAIAKSILLKEGIEAYNGGSWARFDKKI